MRIRDITNYLHGKLTEDEAMSLWEKLLLDDEGFMILEMVLMLQGLLITNIKPYKK